MLEEIQFANVLKSLRVRKGKEWTQAKTADALGVSRRTYVGWENGESIPSSDDLKNITNYFKLNEQDAAILYQAAAQVPPRIHNIPFQRNPFFTGRKTQLELLAQFLKESGSVALSQPIVISGLGGIGKTQLALEYAHRSYPDVYRAVFWVNAADSMTLQAGYNDLGRILELPERIDLEPYQRIQAVKHWLEEHTNWLLIMDNADDLQLARAYLPVKPGGHILLTTRSQIVGTIGRRIEIGAMGPTEGLLFLLRRSGLVKDETDIATIPSDVRDTAATLVVILGGIPLVLDQAGAYIEETGASFADYIQLYEEARHSLLNRRGSSGNPYGDHPESIAATLELCYRKACEEHPLAEGLLCICSVVFFLSTPIRDWIFQSPSTLNLDSKTLNEVIAVLRRYSLIERNSHEKTIWLHPLVRATLKDTISPDSKEYWLDQFYAEGTFRFGISSKSPLTTIPLPPFGDGSVRGTEDS